MAEGNPLRPPPPKMLRFVDEYLIDLNASRAYQAVYQCSKAAAEASAYRLLADPRTGPLIAQAKAERAKRLQLDADMVLRRLWLTATADPRELIEYRRTCCRYCYGTDFGYQRTNAEMAKDRRNWESLQKKTSTEVFDEQGGIGYIGTKEPHVDCPECFGQGVEKVYVHDTRQFSEAARALYAGVKITDKGGTEVLMQNQQTALALVAKHLGVGLEQKESPVSEEERIQRMRKALLEMDIATAA